jgi:hypothetical protein
MKTYAIIFVLLGAFMMTGCQSSNVVINYPAIESLATTSILHKYAGLKTSDITLLSVKSEMDANGKELTEVTYLAPSSAETKTVGSAKLVTTKTYFVHLHANGTVEYVGDGMNSAFK